ncbi:MAG: transposase [Egibacteraceae bacterium]
MHDQQVRAQPAHQRARRVAGRRPRSGRNGQVRRRLPAPVVVERSIAWVVKDGYRRCRYRGVRRNQLWLSLRVAVVNLTTLLGLGPHYDGGWKVPATT